MNRFVMLALLLALTLIAPITQQPTSTPTPAPTGSPTTSKIPIPTRAASAGSSTPIPGPTEQPGLFASDAEILARGTTGPFLRGDDDVLAVVGIFPADSGNEVMVALRNNTDSQIDGAEVTASLRETRTDASSESATTVALGITSRIVPATIVPGGLSFALITLKGANGLLGLDNLPDIDVQPAQRNRGVDEVELRLISATVTESDVLAAVVIDSGSAISFQMLVVCVQQDGSQSTVAGWSNSVTLDEFQLTAGDTTTIRSGPPKNCGGRYIVTVAGH